MKDQVPHKIRKIRNHILKGVFSEKATVYREKFISRTLPVLWESVTQVSDEGWRLEGWSGNYIRISANSPEPRWNQINNVKLIKTTMDGMAGEIMEIP
jgi:tRNA A37 methylthiotransferase MiaB